GRECLLQVEEHGRGRQEPLAAAVQLVPDRRLKPRLGLLGAEQPFQISRIDFIDSLPFVLAEGHPWCVHFPIPRRTAPRGGSGPAARGPPFIPAQTSGRPSAAQHSPASCRASGSKHRPVPSKCSPRSVTSRVAVHTTATASKVKRNVAP